MSILLEAINNVGSVTIFLLLLSLILALFYEMINGFHDTANAVAMIIYTNSMKARNSVVMSGVMNFLGVIAGGIGVAYAIVHLLPLEVMVSSNQQSTLIMIYSLLLAALIWNFGTWYYGLPVSSSHSLIGSLVGVSAMFGMMNGFEFSQSINFKVLYSVLGALALSPLLGFGLAYVLMKLSRTFLRVPKFYKSPQNETKRKRPNFWMRIGIIITGAGVSFAHGSNDGQKGMGLIMIILIGILPAYYALDMSSHQYRIQQVHDSAKNLTLFYEQNKDQIDTLIGDNSIKSALKTKTSIDECNINNAYETIAGVATKLNTLKTYNELSIENRWSVHSAILCSDNFFAQVEKSFQSQDKEIAEYIALQRKTLIKATEYVPTWVIISVALALGIGTMIGYKRVVLTIGEKIGSQPINYMQGTVAQSISMITILLSNFAHAPVSTTQIVSSSIAGTMVAQPNGSVQKKTIKIILLSWLFTLPVTALMGGAIYYFLSFMFL